tara:strand:- start:2516 stop:4132 length:1617 start_codon:yes stop_codon:yes gene_type:complete
MLKNYLVILKHVDKLSLITVFFICLSIPIFSQQKPVFSSLVDTTSIKIGEKINYEIKIKIDTNSILQLEENQLLNSFEIIEEFEIDTFKKAGEVNFIKRFSITCFEPGPSYLKSPKILVDDVLYYSDSILINVLNVKVDTVSKKFFDIKNITELQKNHEGWWKKYFSGALVLILMFFGYKIYEKIVNSKLEKEKAQPPIEKAIIALKLLEAKDLKEQLDYKQYYSKLTEIVKNYFEEDISMDALESTTDELIDKLELLKDVGKLSLNTETIQNFKSVLKTADLVKFAKSNPGIELASSDKKLLETVLLDTKKAIPEPTEEELLKNKEYLEKLKKERRNKIIKKLFIFILSFSALILATSISIYGWKNVSDILVGNSTKDLLNKTWVKSTYGAHPITIQTPNVLKRKDSEQNIQSFEWTSKNSNILIFLKIESGSEKIEQEEGQSVVDKLILELEKIGGKNILTKEEEIFLENGAPAFKFFGSFDYLGQGELAKRKEYVFLKFQENSGKQIVLIVFERENLYAEEIAKKIEESIIFKIE